MAEEDFRSYTISGELCPQHWDTLLKQLGRLGLVAEEMRTESAEDSEPINKNPSETGESCPDVLLGRMNFYGFADTHGYTRRIAGTAWNALVALYYYKHYPDSYKTRSWYKTVDYTDIRLVFERIPSNISSYLYSRDAVSDLRLSSLEELLNLVDRKTKESSDFRLMGVYGNKVGPKTLQFLRDLAAAKRAEIEVAQD